MGRTTIVPENRISSEVERFATLRLQQVNERARIACLERQQYPDGRNVLTPWMEFVHRIEGVQEENGVPMQKKITRKDKATGQELSEMVWATAWVGSPICLGDKTILLEKGLDPGNCPVCHASQQYPEITAHRGFGAPVVRYAMNVVRFSTRPGGFVLADPFGAQIVVWSFTEKRFNRLDDLNRKLADRGELQFRMPDGTIGTRPYDITDVDLMLGPCEDVGWQRFEIDVAEGLAMWRRSQATAQYIQQLWLGAGMRATDEQLQLACGRPVTNRGYLDADIAKAVGSWNKALRGGPAPTVDPFGASFGGQQGAQDMQAGMNDMLSQLPPAPAPAMAVPQVTQPSVQPAMPAVPQVPQVTQPTVQPTPPAPPQPAAQELPPAPPTQAQLDAMAGGHGLDQFAQQQPTALVQAAQPELAAMQQQQVAQFQAAGVPGVAQAMVPPPPPPVPATAQPQPAMPAVPAAAPAALASTAPQIGMPTAPPQTAPPASAADLFAAPATPPPAPDGAALEFNTLANF